MTTTTTSTSAGGDGDTATDIVPPGGAPPPGSPHAVLPHGLPSMPNWPHEQSYQVINALIARGVFAPGDDLTGDGHLHLGSTRDVVIGASSGQAGLRVRAAGGDQQPSAGHVELRGTHATGALHIGAPGGVDVVAGGALRVHGVAAAESNHVVRDLGGTRGVVGYGWRVADDGDLEVYRYEGGSTETVSRLGTAFLSGHSSGGTGGDAAVFPTAALGASSPAPAPTSDIGSGGGDQNPWRVVSTTAPVVLDAGDDGSGGGVVAVIAPSDVVDATVVSIPAPPGLASGSYRAPTTVDGSAPVALHVTEGGMACDAPVLLGIRREAGGGNDDASSLPPPMPPGAAVDELSRRLVPLENGTMMARVEGDDAAGITETALVSTAVHADDEQSPRSRVNLEALLSTCVAAIRDLDARLRALGG